MPMSLEGKTDVSLEQLAGRLETLESDWAIAATKERRKEIDNEFEALAEQIKEKYGAKGERVLDYFLARHRRLFS
jgi:chaperonin cofactor prefoldin